MDRQGAPLALFLSDANMHDSVPLAALLDAVTPVAGQPGRPRQSPKSFTPTKRMISRAVAAVTSNRASSDLVSKTLNGWGVIVGLSKERSPGWIRCAASRHAMRDDRHPLCVYLAGLLTDLLQTTQQSVLKGVLNAYVTPCDASLRGGSHRRHRTGQAKIQ